MHQVSRIYFSAHAGFANPEVYEYLEAEGISPAFAGWRNNLRRIDDDSAIIISMLS